MALTTYNKRYFQRIIDDLVTQRKQYKPTETRKESQKYEERYISNCFTVVVDRYDEEKKTLYLTRFYIKLDSYTLNECKLNGSKICQRVRQFLTDLKERLSSSDVNQIVLNFEDASEISFTSLNRTSKKSEKFRFRLLYLKAIAGYDTFYMEKLGAELAHMDKADYKRIFEIIGNWTLYDCLKNNQRYFFNIVLLRYFILKYKFTKDVTLKEIMRFLNKILNDLRYYPNKLKEIEFDDDNLLYMSENESSSHINTLERQKT